MPISRPIKHVLLLAAITFVLPATSRAWTMEDFAEQSDTLLNGDQTCDWACDPIGCDATGCDCCETPIQRYRKSFYQGSEILGGYLFDLGDKAGGLDQTFEEARISFGVPLGSMDNLLGLRPFFRADHLNGPSAIDVPGTVYNTGVSIFNQCQWSDTCSTTLLLTPSVRSDFKTQRRAFRLFGLALWNWQCRDDLKLSVGAVYFDRADFQLLPAFGFSWTPTPQWKIDATMPRPSIARRLWKDGGIAEGWAFFGGSIGGTTWAVTRDSGLEDELTLRDFRMLLGYEEIRSGNRGCFVECGFAFGRTIEYERRDIEIDLDSGFFAHAGWRF